MTNPTKEFNHTMVSHVENGAMAYDDAHIKQDAQHATEKEHEMTVWQGLKLYPKAVLWSLVLSTAIVMEGYDVVLMGSFYAHPAFKKKYGELNAQGEYNISAQWQAGLSNAMQAGQILGLFATGILCERFGYKKTIMGALALLTGFIFILFFAQNKATLLVGELCMGLPLGVFQTVTVAYASEICPVVLRCYLTTYVNLCWVMGQLIASGVLKALLTRTDEWSYRIPFAVQWIWPVPIFIGVFLAPESPWWLVRQGREEEARETLERITGSSDQSFSSKETVAMMIHTNELEKEMQAGTSYLDCFKGVNLRRTEVVCLTWAAQNLCGAGLMGYSTYFYTQAGLATSNAFNMSLGQYGLGFLGVLLSWVLMTYLGRRTLYVGGLAILNVILFAIGFISLAGPHNASASWATGSMLLVYTFFYDSTVGPVCYSLVSELASTRLRSKMIVLSRNLYNMLSIVNGILFPYMLNQDAWNWRGKAGFFWGGCCALCVVWAFFRLPEPKGRTYGELDILFESKISARKFKTAVVNQFANSADVVEKRVITSEHKETAA